MSEEKRKIPRRGKIIGLIIGVVAVVAIAAITYLFLSGSSLEVPGDHRTIQDAIEAAEDGDIIVVEPGVYYEQIDFLGKDITVRSTDPEDPAVVAETVIDGRKRGSVVTFQNGESTDAVLQGFTITNGVGTEQIISHQYEGNDLTNEGSYGGGIFISESSSPTITQNVITGNDVDMDGGGIAVFYGSNPTISNNTIESNSAFNGGGISIWDASPIIENNLLRENRALNMGAGVTVDYQSAAMR